MRQLVIAMTILLYTSIISHLSVNSHWIQKFNILRWGRNKGRRNVSSVSMQKRNHSTNDEKTFKAYGLQVISNVAYLPNVQLIGLSSLK